ncbi:DUF397 domain-containing protein [Streptomyces sp. NPDC004838]
MKMMQATERDEQLRWHKSSYSGSGGGNCVEVAAGADVIHIRDSKNHGGPIVTLSSRSWAAFLAYTGNHRPN